MLGWMLERAEMTCRLLDVRYGQLVTAGATGGFHPLLQTLKSALGSEAFRRRYRASMDPADVVEFLLLSRTFPRLVLFCLRSVENDLARLEAGGLRFRPQRILGRTRSDLEFLDTHELLEGDLHVFLDHLPERRAAGGRGGRPAVLPERTGALVARIRRLRAPPLRAG